MEHGKRIGIIDTKFRPEHIEVYRLTNNKTLVYNETYVEWLLLSAFGFETKGKKYICGMVTGRSRLDVLHEFNRVADLIGQNGDYPVNPIQFVPEDLDWETAMRLCIAELMKCDELIRLTHWNRSKGAIMEVELADKLGIKVTDLKDYENRCKR